MIPHAFAKKEDEESIVSYDYEKAKEVKWWDRILLNRPLKIILALLFVGILAPVLIYQFVFYNTSDLGPADGFSPGSCLIPRENRIPCGPPNTTQSECHQQCCYDLQNHVCFQRVPSRFSYLVLPIGSSWTEESIMIPRLNTVPFKLQPSVSRLRLSVDEVSSTHLSFTFYRPENISLNGSRIEEKSYDYHIASPELNIIVNANRTNPIFNTMRGPIIASDNIWEIAFKLTDESMYGFGELPLKPGTVKVIYSNERDSSSIPLIYARSNGSYHGLLIDVKTPTEVTIGQDNHILLRSITTTGLKLHLFTGPEPKDIMKDVIKVIGSRGQLEYWMLGVHVCSELGLDDAEALTNMTSFLAEVTRARIPVDSHCGIKPIVFESGGVDSTAVDTGARTIRSGNRRFLPHVSPYINFDPSTIVPGCCLEYNDTCILIACDFGIMMLRYYTEGFLLYPGQVNGQQVAYPDYAAVNASDLLTRLWTYDMVLDGVLLENNWPIDEREKPFNETFEYLDLPYFTKDFEAAFNHTPLWNAVRPPVGDQYFYGDFYLYNHNEYGSHFLDVIKNKFSQASSIPTYSTSQWMRGDAVVNRQGVQTSWLGLRTELVAAALGGISGHWLWSTPICGDTENFNLTIHASLCVKWYMAGTFLPMMKVHSKTERRDVLAFQGIHQTYILTALSRRLMLMPYYHTVLQDGPLLRPMFYQFPHSEELVDLSSQFSVGDDLLIVPNLLPSQTHVHVWMPPGTWYEFWSGLRITAEEGQVISMTTTEADFVTLIRGGSIVATQRTVRETADTTRRNSDFTLVVATERVNITKGNDTEPIETDYAEGRHTMSGNMTIFFRVQENQLYITYEGDDFDSFCGGSRALWNNMIRNIDIYGLPEELNNFDNHRNVNIMMGVNMCNLGTQELVVALV